MRSDPRIGLSVCSAITVAALAWLVGQWIAADAIFERLSYAMHAITLFSIFAVLAAGAAAGIFWRFARVKAELLAGRRVLARWQVDAATLARFAPTVRKSDRQEKRQALFLIWFFLAVVFGGFAIYDAEAAVPMLAIAAAMVAATGLAFLLGERVTRSHWQMFSGEVIVGERGLLFNGVLHVWRVPLSWLSAVVITRRPTALVVTYGYWSRFGPQYVTVAVPVRPDDIAVARQAEERLRALLSTPSPLRRSASRAASRRVG